jgi:hypothetical protein
MSQRLRAFALLLLLTALVLPRAGAQRITGVVRDTNSRATLSGAVVSVLDAQRQSLARAITDVSGHFSIEAPASATQLRVVRIGFQPRILALPASRASSPTLDITMTKVPTLLSTVMVSDDRMCSSDRDRPAALSLWEQARSGLLASIVARESKPANATIISYERWIDLSRRRVIRQTARKQSGRTTRPFVTPTEPRVLAQRGYLERVGNELSFNAPDADVLLDESFAETHCFSVRNEDSAHVGAIGVAFEPTRGRDRIVDVRGTLWLEAIVPALRTIEFSFVGADAATVLGDAAGIIHFRSMPNGVVFVDEWYTRTPVMVQTRDAGRQLRIGRSVASGGDVVDTRPGRQASETGGVVTSAAWPDGERWESPLKPLTGTVSARGAMTPLRGALVVIDATGDTVLTDERGRWAIFPVFPGRYEVTAADTSYSAFIPLRVTKADVDVTPAEQKDVRLELPGRTEALYSLCGDVRTPGPTSTLLGRLVDIAGNNAVPKGIRISTSWFGRVSQQNGHLRWSNEGDTIEPDDKGRFSLCGVPWERALHFAVGRLGVRVADTLITIERNAEVQELTWRMNLDALRNLVAQQPARLQGHVTTQSAGSPLARVDLWLPLLDRHATTDAAGAFAFDTVPAGYHMLEVRQLGFAAQHDTLRLATGSVTTRDYALVMQKTQLDTIRSISDATRHLSPALRGFEDRRANRTSGYFIAEKELRSHDVEQLASLILAKVAGLKIVPGIDGGAYLASTIKLCQGRAFGSVDSCKPCFVTTYVDGALTYTADGPNERAEPQDFNRISIGELAGVEFYPRDTNAPPGFIAARSGCGLLLLWTRER